MNDNVKAAAILRQYAGELYQGHTIGGEWDAPHIKAEHDELIALADRLALADAGGAVAWQYRVGAGDSWVAVNTKMLADHAAAQGCETRPLYAHPTPDSGRVAELEAQLARVPARAEHVIHAQADRIAALEQQLTESRERGGRMREAARMAKQEFDYQRAHKTLGRNDRTRLDELARITDAALAAGKEKNDGRPR